MLDGVCPRCHVQPPAPVIIPRMPAPQPQPVPREVTPAPPAFVELVASQAESLSECTIELEGRRGKLRIQLKGASASDMATLSRALWEAAS